MTLEIRRADFVLMVCTEIYRRRAEHGEEPGKGRGVLWEAKLIYNDLYKTDSPSQKYIPILLNGPQPDQIPAPLQALTYYSVDTDQGYQDLYRHLTNQPLHLRPSLGTLKSLPPKEPLSYPSSLAGKPAPRGCIIGTNVAPPKPRRDVVSSGVTVTNSSTAIHRGGRFSDVAHGGSRSPV
jgi:hypothetical protein